MLANNYRKALQYILDNPGCTVDEIKKASNLSDNAVSALVSGALETPPRGALRKGGIDKYHLSSEGLQTLVQLKGIEAVKLAVEETKELLRRIVSALTSD